MATDCFLVAESKEHFSVAQYLTFATFENIDHSLLEILSLAFVTFLSWFSFYPWLLVLSVPCGLFARGSPVEFGALLFSVCPFLTFTHPSVISSISISPIRFYMLVVN